jgi:predicted transposase YdaD
MPVTLDYRKGTIFNEGKQKGKEIVAFELHKMGLELAQISQATKFTTDHLKKLFNIS